MREIVHIQAGQCGNQIGAKVSDTKTILLLGQFHLIFFLNRKKNIEIIKHVILVIWEKKIKNFIDKIGFHRIELKNSFIMQHVIQKRKKEQEKTCRRNKNPLHIVQSQKNIIISIFHNNLFFRFRKFNSFHFFELLVTKRKKIEMRTKNY